MNYQKLRIVSNNSPTNPKFKIQGLFKESPSSMFSFFGEKYLKREILIEILNKTPSFLGLVKKSSIIERVDYFGIDYKYFYNNEESKNVWYDANKNGGFNTYSPFGMSIFYSNAIQFDSEKAARNYIKSQFGEYGLSLIEKAVEKWEQV